MNFNRVFHHKPSILGPYFWKHPLFAGENPDIQTRTSGARGGIREKRGAFFSFRWYQYCFSAFISSGKFRSDSLQGGPTSKPIGKNMEWFHPYKYPINGLLINGFSWSYFTPYKWSYGPLLTTSIGAHLVGILLANIWKPNCHSSTNLEDSDIGRNWNSGWCHMKSKSFWQEGAETFFILLSFLNFSRLCIP